MSLVFALAACGTSRAGAAGPFVRLTPLPAPKIVAAAEKHSGGFGAANLLDGIETSEYASNGKGTATFVVFDFGATVTIGAFRHVDRHDVALVAASQLTFSDADGRTVATIAVPHVGQPAGVTMFALPKPVTAQKVRWQVTRLVNNWATCPGGREIAFYKPGPIEPAPNGIGIDIRAESVVQRQHGRLVRPLVVTLDYPYATPIDAVLRVDGQEPRPLRLQSGSHILTFPLPVVEDEQSLRVAVDYAGQTVAARTATLRPARNWVVYVLPHSHVDIGYTHVQTEVERKQWRQYRQGIGTVREDGRLSARGTVQVERRGALGDRQLLAATAGGKAAKGDRRRPLRADSSWTPCMATN